MTEQRGLLGMPEGADALDMIERGAEDQPAHRWAPMLASMVAVLENTYGRLGLEKEQAAKLATAGVLAQAEYVGGRMFYLPRGDRLRRALRDAEIFHRANGRNIQILAAEFGITDIQVYRICKQQRNLLLAKVQGRLFKDSTEGV